MARPSADVDNYLRRYRNVRKSAGGEEKIRILEILSDEEAAAKLNFQEWAAEHDWYIIKAADRANEKHGRITPSIVAEFELAFVRCYRDQHRVALDQRKLVAQFNRVVDALKDLQTEAALAASLGDRFGEQAWNLASLLIDPQVQSSKNAGKIVPRLAPAEKARRLLGAFARHRKSSSKMGAPWTHERRCAHALAKAWHRAFRSLPNEGQRELFHDLLCSILPGDDPPDMALTYRTLQLLRKFGQFRTRAYTPWDDGKQ